MHPQILLHGSPEPLPEPLQLRAGNLSVLYEAGFLRYLKVGETEILRMINYYIRDHNWGTIPMIITNEVVEESSRGFRITYESECRQGDIRFKWKCTIQGKEDSSISFEISGEALSSFRRNRLGFTVLHPITECAGKNCTIIHSDKREEVLVFPELIHPHQPFFDITAMRWNPAESVEAELHFEGEIFETEDQRNWTDASYKTYCTPLYKPFPAQVNVGDKVTQSIHFRVNATTAIVREKEKPLTFTIDRTSSTPFPQIGLTWSDLPQDSKILETITSLGVDFVRVVVNTDAKEFTESVVEALKSTYPLQVVLFADGSTEEAIINQLFSFADRIKHVIVLPLKNKSTTEELINRTVPLLRKKFPKAKIGGGTDAFFTELNRERTPTKDIDFLTFSINPQAHATDNATMVENLESLRDVIHSCRAFAGSKDVHVGPVTLKTRWNPAATSEDKGKNQHDPLPPSVDPRQLSMIGAAWMLGCIKYLAESSVSSISMFETCGWKGLLPHPDQPWPSNFIDKDDATYPMYVVLKEILRKKHCRVVKLVSTNPLLIDGVALADNQGKLTVMLANFSRRTQSIAFPANVGVSGFGIWDSITMTEHVRDPNARLAISREIQPVLTLPSYSVSVFQ